MNADDSQTLRAWSARARRGRWCSQPGTRRSQGGWEERTGRTRDAPWPGRDSRGRIVVPPLDTEERPAVYLPATDNCNRTLQSRLPGVNQTVIASHSRVAEPCSTRFASSRNTPAPRRLTIIIVTHGLQRLGLRPRWHAKHQDLAQGPDPIGQPSRQRWRLRLPHFGGAHAVGGYRLRQGLAYARMREAKIVVDLIQGELLPHAILTLTQRAPPSADCRHMLANEELLENLR